MRLLYLWLQTLLQFAFSKRFTPRACRTHFVSRPFPAPTPTPAQLWDTATGEATKSYVGHSAPVHCVIFAKDGARIVSASRDHTLKVGQRCPDTPLSLPSSWGCADRDKAYRNTTISTTPSAFLMPDETGWKCTQMVHIFVPFFSRGRERKLSFNPPVKRQEVVACLFPDSAPQVWDTETKEDLHTLIGHTNTIYCCAVYNNLILSCSSDGNLKASPPTRQTLGCSTETQRKCSFICGPPRKRGHIF